MLNLVDYSFLAVLSRACRAVQYNVYIIRCIRIAYYIIGKKEKGSYLLQELLLECSDINVRFQTKGRLKPRIRNQKKKKKTYVYR